MISITERGEVGVGQKVTRHDVVRWEGGVGRKLACHDIAALWPPVIFLLLSLESWFGLTAKGDLP